ncbi:unnamed protein product [Dovyalis caffra]|uniref:Uncharacterized protein n=1 Tax=Dovyalis caffra TaxID=77055 RepID=A0AAV1SNL3_9ROSI|nr:unnamed protein product [Dovyalis caffra]
MRVEGRERVERVGLKRKRVKGSVTGTRGEAWKVGSMEIDGYDEEGNVGWWGLINKEDGTHYGLRLVGLIASFVR